MLACTLVQERDNRVQTTFDLILRQLPRRCTQVHPIRRRQVCQRHRSDDVFDRADTLGECGFGNARCADGSRPDHQSRPARRQPRKHLLDKQAAHFRRDTGKQHHHAAVLFDP